MAIVPPARPKRDRALLNAVLERYGVPEGRAVLVFVRGHYLDSLGSRGTNDINLFDDAAYLVTPSLVESWNANTDPAFVRKNGRNLAMLRAGPYQFYPDFHKPGRPGAYRAFRPYPEGRRMPCTRAGVPSEAQYTNIHKGGASKASADRTWSEGCLTVYGPQWPDFYARVSDAIAKHPQPTGAQTRTGKESKLIDVILIENRLHDGKQFWTDHNGKIII